MVFCSETLVSSRRPTSELIVPGFGRPMQLLNVEDEQFRGLTPYVREGFSVYRQRSYECSCCEVVDDINCSSSYNFYVFGVYQNSDLSVKIFNCLLTATANEQSVDRKASFFACLLAM